MTRTCHATISRSLLPPHLVGRERRLPPDLVDVAPIPVAHEHVPHAHAGRYLIVADRYTRPNAGRPTRLRRTSHLARAVSTWTIVAARQMRFMRERWGDERTLVPHAASAAKHRPSPRSFPRATRARHRETTVRLVGCLVLPQTARANYAAPSGLGRFARARVALASSPRASRARRPL